MSGAEMSGSATKGTDVGIAARDKRDVGVMHICRSQWACGSWLGVWSVGVIEYNLNVCNL